MKLSTKFLLIITIGVIAIILVMTTLVFNFTKVELGKSIGAEQLSTAAQTMEVMDRFLYERTLDIQVISGSSTLTKHILEDLDPIEGSARFERYQLTTGPWDILNVVDTEGTIVLSTIKEEINQSVKKYPDSSLAFEAGINDQIYYSDMIISANTGKPTVIFAAPIYDTSKPDKPIVGTVLGHISWQSIQEILDRSTSHAVLLNSKGIVIAHNTKYYSDDIFGKDYSDKPHVKKLLTGKSESVISKKDEDFVAEETLEAWVPQIGYLSYKGSGWGLVLEEPVSVAFAPASRTAAIISASSIPVFIAWTVFLLFIFKKIVSNPIMQLTRVSKSIADGDLRARSEIVSKDEFGELANSFNFMTDQLRQTNKEREEKSVELSMKLQDLEDSKKATLNLLEDLNETKTKIQIEQAKDEAILASIGDGMIAMDQNGVIININNQAAKLLGLQKQEMLGHIYHELWETADNKGTLLPLDQRPIQKAILGEAINSNEYQYVRKDKTIFPVSLTVCPVKVDDKIIGVIDIFRDISHEKNVDRMKTEFISLASHQLRTPLSAMKWFLEMLLEGDAGKLTSKQTEFVKNVDDSNQRMIELVNSLLNVSRIESGRIIIDPIPTDMGELTQGVIKELVAKFAEKKQSPIISVSSNLPKINIDPKLIRQVYMNLLTNAIKYTPTGGEITIFISKKGDEILSQISDSGYGIPSKEQHRIFQKFYRGENIIKTVTDGNGLGLYLVKSIVESSGGKIWFKSTEGKGTTFWFSLPMVGSKPHAGEVTLS